MKDIPDKIESVPFKVPEKIIDKGVPMKRPKPDDEATEEDKTNEFGVVIDHQNKKKKLNLNFFFYSVFFFFCKHFSVFYIKFNKNLTKMIHFLHSLSHLIRLVQKL